MSKYGRKLKTFAQIQQNGREKVRKPYGGKNPPVFAAGGL